MNENAFSVPPAAPKKPPSDSLFQKMRKFVDRVPTSVKVAAKVGGLIAGKMIAEDRKEAFEDVAEAMELQQERIVLEQKSQSEAEAAQRAFSQKVGEQFARSHDAVVLDFMAGFTQLTPDVIRIITENTTVPSSLFRSPDDQFPSGDQLGQLAQSKFTTVYLNSTAFDRNLPQYQWLELTRKVRPDREFPKKTS